MKNDVIRSMAEEMFGPQVGVGLTDPRSDSHSVFPREQSAVARALPARQREFAAGRAAARMALAAIDTAPEAIPAAPDRSPVWPTGITGSISHCDSLCIAVACRTKTWRAIGVDIEGKTPLEKEAWPIILTQAEHTQLQSMSRWRRPQHVKTLFSIKEAVYKAQYQLTAQMCDFQAVTVTLHDGRFEARLNHPLGTFRTGFVAHGRYLQLENWVMSGCMFMDF